MVIKKLISHFQNLITTEQFVNHINLPYYLMRNIYKIELEWLDDILQIQFFYITPVKKQKNVEKQLNLKIRKNIFTLG